MAFPKKGMRKITVNDVKYAYNITGNDDFISYSIGLLDKNGQILTGTFSYNSNIVTHFERNGIIKSWSIHQRITITPKTICQVIKYGLKNGWNPTLNKGQLNLGNIEDQIELNLNEITLFPVLKNKQVAVSLAKTKTGQVLRTDKELYLGEGEIYSTFDTVEEAKKYANKIVCENEDIECWILTDKDKAVHYISKSEKKEFTNE